MFYGLLFNISTEKSEVFLRFFRNPVVFFYLCATNYQTRQLNEKMNESGRKVEDMVKAHRGTIYTVCYMFSNEMRSLNKEIYDFYEFDGYE